MDVIKLKGGQRQSWSPVNDLLSEQRTFGEAERHVQRRKFGQRENGEGPQYPDFRENGDKKDITPQGTKNPEG